jgi:hypothetical protein
MPHRSSALRPLLTLLAAGALGLALAPGCGSEGGGSGGDGSRGDGGVGDLFDREGGPGGPCEGLECLVVDCAGSPTTVSGTVFAPNGTLPLYNAVVFVPNAPLDPIAEGASCDRCGDVSGSPVTSTLTDTRGKFVLKNVPVGDDIPLVIQIGKWRREIKLPPIVKCTDNPIDKALTHLPKNQSEGHIPKIAITTGRCDHLACLLPKLGLDASEYTAKGGSGRLNLYRGAEDTSQVAPAPAGTPDATTLWGDVDTLKAYDMVMLSCECDEHNETKPDSAKRALYEYAKLGGRVFASHYHYTWFQNSPIPELRNLAEWAGDNGAKSGLDEPFLVDESFPKGQALAEWLVNVAASTKKGEIPINQARADVVGVSKPGTTRWVYNKPFGDPETTKYLSFNTPVGEPVENQCGKVVFGDMHITGADTTTLPDDAFPASCPKELTPAEKALIFLFFDLASCVQKDDDAPVPPVK